MGNGMVPATVKILYKALPDPDKVYIFSGIQVKHMNGQGFRCSSWHNSWSFRSSRFDKSIRKKLSILF